MELPEKVKQGLLLINKYINSETFKKLLDNAFASLNAKPDIHNMTAFNLDADIFKEIYAALLSFILEITKYDLSGDSVDLILIDLNFSDYQRNLFLSMYGKQKERLRIMLGRIGKHPPHIVNVHWKMDHVIKTNNLNHLEGPIYRISLQTDANPNADQSLNKINFSCNTQQLQDLLYKLKDAVRHCERISQEN